MSSAPRFVLSAFALAALLTVALPGAAAAAPARPAGLAAVVESGLRFLAHLLPGRERAATPESAPVCSVINEQQICVHSSSILLGAKGNRGCAIDPLGQLDC